MYSSTCSQKVYPTDSIFFDAPLISRIDKQWR